MDFQAEEEHHSNPFPSGCGGDDNDNINDNNNDDDEDIVVNLSGSEKEGISRARWNEDIMMHSHDEEEHHQNPFLSSSGNRIVASLSKPQFRKLISRARWNEEMMMGEIIEKKGQIWATTGVVRDGGKLYCSIEEILFLAEKGALILLDATDTIINLKDIYKMVHDDRSGCSWESFLAYRRLKSLGYIVGRHGVSWTFKHDKKCCSLSIKGDNDLNENANLLLPQEMSESNKSIISQLNELHITELEPEFDVYLPDSKFKKSSPGNPFCVLCIIRGNPPTRAEMEQLKMTTKGVPVKFCHVDHWLVNFFSYDKVELPVLP